MKKNPNVTTIESYQIKSEISLFFRSHAQKILNLSALFHKKQQNFPSWFK